MRKASIAVLTGATVQCDVSEGSCCCVMLLLLYTKQVPRTYKGVCWNATKDKADSLFEMQVQGSFSLLRTTSFKQLWQNIWRHTPLLLSMTAHEIISQQWVKVPYFPMFDVVDKMGEKQFGNIQIASILTYWAGWEQNIKTTATYGKTDRLIRISKITWKITFFVDPAPMFLFV